MDMGLQKLLSEKLTTSRQRTALDQLLEGLPPELAGPLRACACVFTPESDAALARFLPAGPDGIGSPAVLPAGYLFQRFDRPEDVWPMAWRLRPPVGRQRAYLLLRDAVPAYAGGLPPQLPTLLVDAATAFTQLPALWPHARSCLALVATDLSFGLVIDGYSGSPPGDSQAELTVYEVAAWPVSEA